ncbi:amidohydrolase family protein [Streptomyces griseorubiginosus]|uniref:amidohydrolase family protein n=1 Tax=Streptomyces griseorubiginosus TaxID=67304 RepID=UPI001AD7142D|nr:amidohydrolase family protein [Streptomyces griseorubiginosus]MBO4252340.1 amidohydrolase family protein [Streptomyces griseorubiginosus]
MRPLAYLNAHLLTQDQSLGELVGGILVVDGRIADIGPRIQIPETAEVVDATGMAIVPGFVDTHRHMWETSLRGMTAWRDYSAYVRVIRSEFGGLVTPEDVYAGDLLGMLGALETGITTIRDESHVQNGPEYTEAVLQALVDGGGRAVLAYGWPSTDTYAWRSADGNRRRHPTYISEVLKRGDSAAGGRVTFAMMIRGPELSDMDSARADLAYARSLGLRSSLHIGGVESSRHHGVAALERAGLLGSDLLFIHCCETSEKELRMMADHGATASVSAYIELAMPGIGRPATGRLVRAGIRPSLSIDAEPTAPTDMFSTMRAVLLAETAQQVYTGESTPVPLTERDVLAFATIEGARASGLDADIGSLTPGKAADLAVIDLRRAGMVSASDPASCIVNYGTANAVVDVLVAGRFVKRAGAMTDAAAVERAVTAAESSRRRLLQERASGRGRQSAR